MCCINGSTNKTLIYHPNYHRSNAEAILMESDVVSEDITDTLEGIELTPEAAKPMREFEFVKDEVRVRELDDPVRLAILKVLMNGIDDTKTTRTKDQATGDTIIRQRDVKRVAMSVVEIVKSSAESKEIEEVTKNQVYHHLPKLIEAGFVIKYGTVTTGKRTTDYYRRTAKGFILVEGALGAANERILREKSEYAIDKMLNIFNIKITDEEKKELTRLRFEAFKKEIESRKQIMELIKSDVADKEVLDLFEFLITVFALGSEDYIDLYKRMRAIIFK
jgi:DNA-binding transcriptional ArsR family regulator